MRVLLVHPGPDFSVADVYRGWAEGLRDQGCEVALYNTNDRLIFYSKALIDTNENDETGHPIVRQAMSQEEAITASMQGLTHACYTFWPDIVLFISGFFLAGGMFEIMRSRRHKLVMLHTESPYQDDEQLARAQFMDINLLNDPCNLKAYEDFGPAFYMPHAYRPQVHYPRKGPVNPELASDMVFIGTAFSSRIEFFSAMDFTGIDFLLGGSDWEERLEKDHPLRKHLDMEIDLGGGIPGLGRCVDDEEGAELYRHSKSGINFYRRESEDQHSGEGWAIGPREVEMAACGLFFLRDPRPESDMLFPMLPAFAGPEDASEQLRWWLQHESEREEAAMRARGRVRNRTFAGNARKLLKLLNL